MRTAYVFELGCELSQTKRKEKFVDSEVDLLFSFITLFALKPSPELCNNLNSRLWVSLQALVPPLRMALQTSLNIEWTLLEQINKFFLRELVPAGRQAVRLRKLVLSIQPQPWHHMPRRALRGRVAKELHMTCLLKGVVIRDVEVR